MQVSIEEERRALQKAQAAAAAKVSKLSRLSGLGADALSEEYVSATLADTIRTLQADLAIFGRIDDSETWRVGVYGVDSGGDLLVIDWRAPFATAFYNASTVEPMGLERRVSYVGAIDEIFVEDFATGEVTGSSPLIHALSQTRGDTMRAAVATLQSEQDELVRRDPDSVVVLRGGPGTGKTVVGLHRAAWLVYHHRQMLIQGDFLVIGPSDYFLDFVATVLPALGESNIKHTTCERLFGPAPEVSAEVDWPSVLDQFEQSLYRPQELNIRRKNVSEQLVAEILARASAANLPWSDKRGTVELALSRELPSVDKAEVRAGVAKVMPPMSAAQAFKRLGAKGRLVEFGVDQTTADAWRGNDDGPVLDELKARFDKKPPRYAHVIVDEAQDLTLMELRALQRRAKGLTFVGDDAQRSKPNGIGLRTISAMLGTEIDEMNIAYRMSSEIAEWLNEHAESTGLDVVQLLGIRPTGVDVIEFEDPALLDTELARLQAAHKNVQLIEADDVWRHKGVEYDAVLVDGRQMTARQIYLAASRAAHELVILRP